MTIYHTPENEKFTDEIYIVLSSDEKGEGIVSAMTAQGAMPLLFSDLKMLPIMEKIIEKMANESGKKLIIGKFIRSGNLELSK